MQDTNVRGPSGECAVASVEARVRSRINIWNCKRKSNKQLGPLKELLGTLQIFTTIISPLPALSSHRLNDGQETQGSFKRPRVFIQIILLLRHGNFWISRTMH